MEKNTDQDPAKNGDSEIAAKKKPQRERLNYDILAEIFEPLAKDSGFDGRSSLVVLCRETQRMLQRKLLEDVILTRLASLFSLFSCMNSDSKRIAMVQSLHIQIGCGPAIVPRAARKTREQREGCGIRLEESGPCGHISATDHVAICQLITACAPTLTTIIIHSNDSVIPVTLTVRNITFPNVTEAELPAEMVCFAENNVTPFPSVTKLKIACCDGPYIGDCVTHMDLRSLTSLRQVVISFWKTDERLIAEAMLRLRVPRTLRSCGIERDRGMRLPAHVDILRMWSTRLWLVILMDPRGMEAEMGPWRRHFHSNTGRITSEVGHETMRKFILTETDDSEEIWDKMTGRVGERREHAKREGIYRNA
ncbi:hypothetical protein VNI00_009940 [Paramarasmius palmivorus]|uniref:F-box domain-containing protein n=1 Tax=Paramarasmius palmivorus TaxID=297713 RepID=A0AAW0CP96_9AGAR